MRPHPPSIIAVLIVAAQLSLVSCASKQDQCLGDAQSNKTGNLYLNSACNLIALYCNPSGARYDQSLCDASLAGCVFQQHRLSECRKIPGHVYERDRDID